MGPPTFRQPKIPGPTGQAYGRRLQNSSRFCAWPATGGQGDHETLCAQIFFATNEDALGGDDLKIIQTVGAILGHLQAVGDVFTCACRGHADVRHDSAYNYDLSRRRAVAVAGELRKMLPSSVASWFKEEPFGERGAQTDPSFWAEDRRVDVVVKCQPARLCHPSLGFETTTDNSTEWVFLKDFERMEIDSGGEVKVWVRDEIKSLQEETVFKAKRTLERSSPVIQRLSAMSLDEYVKEVRSRVTAFVRVTYRFVASTKAHRVSAEIFDTVSLALLFPAAFVEAPVLVDRRGTQYLSSSENSPEQVWRHLSPGQQPPPGVRTRTDATAPMGLTVRPGDLFSKLCAGFPNITGRVASTLPAP
jgi:outer membrane protein OmpA-like peptidoglycan-associated protein